MSRSCRHGSCTAILPQSNSLPSSPCGGSLAMTMLRRLNKRRLARLKADILLLDKRMTQIVASNANLARRYDLLTSMRGVGPTLAFTLIALLPELGQMSRKQIAALVGLAPYDFDSGR